jgi:hypothetical protein
LAFPIVIVLRAKRTGAKAEQGLSKTLVAIAAAAMSRPPAQPFADAITACTGPTSLASAPNSAIRTFV